MVTANAHRTRGPITAALAALVMGSAAQAGWTALTGTRGTPIDVGIGSGGEVIVVTADGVYGSGSPTPLFSGTSLRSAFVDVAGCLRVIDSNGVLTAPTGCASDVDTLLGFEVQRVRRSGGAYVWGCSRDASADTFGFSSNGGNSWALMAAGGTCAPPLSALSIPAGEYALFTVAGSPSNLALYRNGAFDQVASTTAGAGSAPLSVQLAGGVGVPLRAFAVTSTGALEIAAIEASVQPFAAIPLPAGATRFQAVAIHQTATERFGLALAQFGDGSVRVLSAVPDPNDGSFGRQWRESTAPPSGALGGWKDVQCLGATACGAITDASGNGSVFAYVNAASPSAPVASPFRVPAAGSVTVAIAASDPDGDAVWVSSRQISPASPLLGLAVGEDGVTLAVSAPSEPICESSTPFVLELRAEDGRAGHLSAPTSLEITVEGTPPMVGELAGAPLLARCDAGGGTPAVTATGDLTHLAPAQACSTQTISWSQTAGPTAMAGTAQGPSVSLRATGASWDDLVGQAVSLQIVASGPTSSSTAVRDVAIAPERPFVRASLAADAPTATELGAVTLSLALSNQSGCAVRGANVVASLEGASLVPGTLRLDGVAIDATPAAGSVRVSQVDLPPGVVRLLTLEVRPSLVGPISARAVAMLGEVPISDPTGAADRPQIGCGCASGGEALALWTVIMIAAAWLRRQMPKEMRRRPLSPRRSSTSRNNSNP